MTSSLFRVKSLVCHRIESILSRRNRKLPCDTLYLFVFFALLSSLTGCGSTLIAVKDTVPRELPRGYVEFYYLVSEGHTGSPLEVKVVESGKMYHEGYTPDHGHFGFELSFLNKEKVGIRIAKRPGTYNFAVCQGTGEVHVQVRVHEAMVTPVRINMRNIERSHGPLSVRVTFTLDLDVEEPVPL